jgi:hypothetical protein
LKAVKERQRALERAFVEDFSSSVRFSPSAFFASTRVDRFKKVESERFQQTLPLDFFESEVSCPHKRESAFQRSEGLFDLESHCGHESVKELLPVGQRLVSFGRVHNSVLY